MKYISVFSKHFWPENFKINEIALKLKKKYDLNVFAARPEYNNINYKKKKNFVRYRGININYFYNYNRESNTFFSIFLNYFSYVINLTFHVFFYRKIKADIVITFATSPIFQVIPALFFSKLKRIPSIIWVQDLWPEVLEDTGYIKNKFILKIINKFVMFVYNRSDAIIAQSDSFKSHIKNNYKIKKKIFTLYQPSDFKFQKYIKKKNKIHYITFAGNFGNAQNLDILIKAFKSKKLKKNIKLNLIGSGKQFNSLKEKIKIFKLKKKINLLSYKNKSDLKKLLSYSSGLVITLKNGKSLNKTIPGKFQTYISFGKPLLISSNSILNSIVYRNNIGYVSKPNDLNKLILNINKISMLNEKKKKGIYLNSKKVYEQNFEIDKITEKLEYILEETHRNYAKKNLL